MSEKFAEIFPVLVLWVFGWMLPASVLALVFVNLGRHGYLRPFSDLFHAARRLSLVGWLCVAPLVVGLVGYASTKNDGGSTNDAPTHMSAPRRLLRSRTEGWLIPSTPVTPDEIAAGYRAPATSVAGIVPVPEGAVTNARWRLRGAHDDAFHPELEGWRFPCRDGVLTGVTVLARGEVRPDVGTLYFPVSPVDGVSLLPASRWGLLSRAPGTGARASVFWHAQSPSNSLLLTWENALVGRDPNCPTNLQAELYADGRFAWRTGGGSRLYLPVLDFDWDGDGLENSVDPDPLVAGSDAHGTNAEWYRVVCTNAFTETSVVDEGEADARLPPGVGFREGANTNGVYFVDLVAEEGPAPVYVVSGQDSLLGSPVLVANPGVTNRVPLVIGVEYAVTSPVPFSVGLPMSGFAELLRDEPTNKTVKWPLDFSFTEESCRDGVRTYSVHVGPYDPGGHFSWEEPEGPHGRASLMSTGPSDSSCGCVSTYGGVVTFHCSPTCNCVGDCKARVSYYSFGSAFTATGGVCRCGFEDPGEEEGPLEEYPLSGGVSVSFSKGTVVFEDSYLDRPGVEKPRRSTYTRMKISAWGGEHGGTLVLTSENLGKLSPVANGPIVFPSRETLRPWQTYSVSFVCQGVEESWEPEDIRIVGRFMENETGNIETNVARMTSVRVELCAKRQAVGNPCAQRHTFGVFEQVALKHYPFDAEMTWSISGGGVTNTSSEGHVGPTSFSSREWVLRCPLYAKGIGLTASASGVRFPVPVEILEPSGIRTVKPRRFDSFPLGHTGTGMYVPMFILPESVNFQEIAIQEIPVEEEPPMNYGCFTNFNIFYQTHTVLAGAGRWSSPDPNNSWGEDHVSCAPTPSLNPGSGWQYLRLPWGWNKTVDLMREEGCEFIDVNGHPVGGSCFREIGNRYDSLDEVHEDGSASASRFGWTCHRMTYGVYFLNGEIVDEN